MENRPIVSVSPAEPVRVNGSKEQYPLVALLLPLPGSSATEPVEGFVIGHGWVPWSAIDPTPEPEAIPQADGDGGVFNPWETDDD